MADTDDLPRPAPGPEPRFVSLKDAVVILGLQFLLLAFRLGQIPLLGPDEPRYARVAVEMARAHELVTPTLAGEAWLEKPPLYYWLAGAAFSVLGGLAFGSYYAVDTALMTEVLPSADARAKDLGILNAANTGGQILAPLIATMVIALDLGFAPLFLTSMIACALGALLIIPIKGIVKFHQVRIKE